MVYKAYAKVNVFLKIVGTRKNYHEIQSRFMLVKNLYDVLGFCPKKTHEAFELVGDFNCSIQSNTIYKMYQLLRTRGYVEQVDELFENVALHVKKNIPTGAGLGGGSSDCATFLKMVNEQANLGLCEEQMIQFAQVIGADVAFFISGYESANVSGIGEIVTLYDEPILDIEVFTPPLECNTALVYKMYREHFLHKVSEIDTAFAMGNMASEVLLSTYRIEELNDLYAACLKVYPELEAYVKEGWFFSGSGSSFFRIKNG
ncbi:MAG: 4-(cytidine 5'-diphospho)-2-C-methyl-D-erythritol kinase [Sulfurospirillaceae bacterium]|jgi:4-diphosphocytidyl-2-C-methyl-D-erythritol kinase|nr:4-(cytidine 5'-diphospho)-2-C-methyl-D-erythritol kinase [Sulfurospirillaceae bacterium]MDD2827629.1 4-(cytidine 5'-diphospho)-2-C-methyl-D-erythritol kinase [Sulfurospirillaceae bacterium]